MAGYATPGLSSTSPPPTRCSRSWVTTSARDWPPCVRSERLILAAAHQADACRSRNSKTSDSSTPGKLPDGSASSTCECARADGQAMPSHRAASAAGGRWQHSPDGQPDVVRSVVSRPRNQRECSYGTPSVTAKPCSRPESTSAVHQYVPDGVSEYWKYGLNRSEAEKTRRPDHWRHIRCPSMAPVGSA